MRLPVLAVTGYILVVEDVEFDCTAATAAMVLDLLAVSDSEQMEPAEFLHQTRTACRKEIEAEILGQVFERLCALSFEVAIDHRRDDHQGNDDAEDDEENRDFVVHGRAWARTAKTQ